MFRPIATNVKAEKRFLSTIARRLDTLGAITRGQRQTGGQGLFRAEDNLESPYARDALRQFYCLSHQGKIDGCSLTTFETVTGLSLTTDEGTLARRAAADHHLPQPPAGASDRHAEPAVRGLRAACWRRRIEGAIAAGTYDKGLETIAAESMVITERRTSTRIRPPARRSQVLHRRRARTATGRSTLDDALANGR